MSISSQSETSASTNYSDETTASPLPTLDISDPPEPPRLDLTAFSTDEPAASPQSTLDVPEPSRLDMTAFHTDMYPLMAPSQQSNVDDIYDLSNNNSNEQNPNLEAQRLNVIAADRKRRLTDSDNGSGRRRTNSGGFEAQDTNRGLGGPSGSAQVSRTSLGLAGPVRRTTGYRQENMRGPMLSQLRRTSSGNARSDQAVPSWQPDSDVSKCPICGIQFTWYYRKHHCRKCGRVVCANCSPHRITIPRQFIVHPPDASYRNSILSSSDTHNVIDLTGEDEPAEQRPALRRPASSQYSNPGLGGGEEVRLCNPCVPDPQPEPQVNFHSIDRQGQSSQLSRGTDFQAGLDSFQQASSFPREDHTTSWLAEQMDSLDSRRRRGYGMIVRFSSVSPPGVD